MNLTLTEPVKYEDIEKWIVCIVGENNLLTGQAETGNTPEEATRKAQSVIDAIKEWA
jgi:predicted RNase H-like HicB family nuclease